MEIISLLNFRFKSLGNIRLHPDGWVLQMIYYFFIWAISHIFFICAHTSQEKINFLSFYGRHK